MGSSVAALRALADVTASQWGMVTTAQAQEVGVPVQVLARLVRLELLERVRHGVYRLVGAPPDPADELRAAWLALTPALSPAERMVSPTVAVVSYRSAADLLRLGNMNAFKYEFTVDGRRQSRDRSIVFHAGTVPPQERTIEGGLPVTTPFRTVVDLARKGIDGEHLAGVARDAVTDRQVDPDELGEALAPWAHGYGLPRGDGLGFVTYLLTVAGVPWATWRAAELAGSVWAERTHGGRSGLMPVQGQAAW